MVGVNLPMALYFAYDVIGTIKEHVIALEDVKAKLDIGVQPDSDNMQIVQANGATFERESDRFDNPLKKPTATETMSDFV
jgi:hypothetical protein